MIVVNKTNLTKVIELLGLLSLSGYGDKVPGKSTGETIAKVNDKEILIEQVNSILLDTIGVNQ